MFASRSLLQIEAGVWSRGLLSGALRYSSVAPQAPLEQTKPATQSEWTPSSRRVGTIAIKLGMSQLWLADGRHMAVTLLQVLDNQVLKVKNEKDDKGYHVVEVGCVNHDKPYKLQENWLEFYTDLGVYPKRKIMEFLVSADALPPVGTPLLAAHFMVGQFIDVRAITTGKGFQGVMKRHGMKGQPASHGVTKTHRKMGATGGGGDPGRIFKGKKMPGRMGGKNATNFNVKIYRINHAFNVLYVKGQVPGHDGQYVKLRDGLWKPHKSDKPPPLPTYFPSDRELPEEEFSDDVQLPHGQVIRVKGQPIKVARKR